MMKKSAIFLLTLFLIFQIVSAVEFEIAQEFKQGETLLAKVSGNFLEPLQKENIFFYRGHVRTPMEYDLAKINNEYYIYAQLLGKSQGNYSISIENIQYMKGAEISEESIAKNFSITNETADFSIEPGFVITQGEFFIEAQNLQDFEITIKTKTLGEETSEGGGSFLDFFFGDTGESIEENSVTLMSGEIKKINFEFENISISTFKKIELSAENLKYEIPVYVLGAGEVPEELGIEFDPSEENISLSTDSNTTRTIYLFNAGSAKLENISLEISDSLQQYVNLSTEKIEELSSKEMSKIKLFISSGGEEDSINGKITASSEDTYAYFDLSLNFIPNYVPPPDEENAPVISRTCSELNGTICGSDEECSAEIINAKDAVCCLGTCEKTKEDSSSTGQIIGWAIVIIIILFLLWFFKKKYKGARKDVNLLKVAKGEK